MEVTLVAVCVWGGDIYVAVLSKVGLPGRILCLHLLGFLQALLGQARIKYQPPPQLEEVGKK